MLEELFYIHHQVAKNIPLDFKRYLYARVDWNTPAICLTGARGVGKTTLLLQHYYQRYADVQQCLYCSADNVEIASNGLFNMAREYFKYGGLAMIIDEIHKYPGWQVELKNILDTFRDKKILVSGSSSAGLKNTGADLSRRLASYELGGLSFREYLALKGWPVPGAITLEELFSDHVRLAQAMTKTGSILQAFRQYLSGGYYPFFQESESAYLGKLLGIIERTLYEDVVIEGRIKASTVPVLKKILWLLATSGSFTVNINKMSRELGISREYVYEYIQWLEAVGLLHGLRSSAKGFALIRKPQKLYLRNPNILMALNSYMRLESGQGIVRETFFVDQVSGSGALTCARQGDFMIDGKYVIEVGGAAKDARQIEGLEHAFLALDGIEIGHGNRIPLYLFGCLY